MNAIYTENVTGSKLFIGILGMALPVILVVGGLFYAGHTVQHSVSHYYHTDLRDVQYLTSPARQSRTRAAQAVLQVLQKRWDPPLNILY